MGVIENTFGFCPADIESQNSQDHELSKIRARNVFVAVKFFSGLVRVHIKHKVSKNDQGEKMIPSGLQISWT